MKATHFLVSIDTGCGIWSTWFNLQPLSYWLSSIPEFALIDGASLWDMYEVFTLHAMYN